MARLAAGPESQARLWAQALARQCQDALADLAFIAPWTSLPEAPSSLDGFAGLDQIPTLRELAGAASRLLPAIEARLRPGATDARLVDRVAARGRRVQPARRRENRRRGTAGASRRRACAHGVRLPLRQVPPPVGHRLQRRTSAGCDASFYDLLASEARLAASSPSRRANCRRRTGSPWAAC